jgi:hypothetical protein
MTTENNIPTEVPAKPAEASKPVRLSPDQETAAIDLLKTSLASGKAGIASAVESILTQPWIVGVEAIVQSWAEMKATARKHLLTGLAAHQTDQGRRFRMSLGRGLLTHDAPTALKLVEAVCAEMLTGENGEPSQKDRQIFANVLIGKGKPWLLHLSLADLKPAGADKIIQCALATCFPGQCPPLTQLSVLRWIAAADKLAKLPEASLEVIAKAVKRWHPKLQAELKRDIPELPTPIEEALKAPPAPPPQAPAPEREVSKPERRENEAREPRQPAPRQPSRQAPQGFDLVNALRQIESHVNSLKSELSHAKSESRSQRGDSGRRGRRNDRGPADAAPEPTNAQFEELQRHNQQLEETITDLRLRLEDLAANHEDIATSMRAHDETPLTDEKEQFKALLGIKLRANYEEFRELAKEPQDEVYKEPFRLLLEDVFVILETHGIALKV